MKNKTLINGFFTNKEFGNETVETATKSEIWQRNLENGNEITKTATKSEIWQRNQFGG